MASEGELELATGQLPYLGEGGGEGRGGEERKRRGGMTYTS